MRSVDKVLVVNSGSSSLKYMLFSMKNETMLCKGLVERIGADNANLVYQKAGCDKIERGVNAADHGMAFVEVCAALTNPQNGILKSLDEIDAIGHRVLHGGMEFSEPVLVDQSVKDAIKRCFPLGPLHNPANLMGIEACEEKMSGVPNVAVFDTGFHMTMPKSSYLYAIPLEMHEKFHIRKYGFHGTSHKFVTQTAAKYLGKPLDKLNIITCHLGNGSSIAAIKNGKVFDTSMGLTPLQGLVMGTRSGDIDPAVIFYLARNGYSIDELDKMLNKQSGLLALGGTGSGDMRDLIKAANSGSEKAQVAFDMFAQRVALYVGGYYALLGGVDAIIFTGGIGENSFEARKHICDHLSAIGVVIDEEVNQATRGVNKTISAPESKFPVVVLPTNEELMIARETYRIVTEK